MHSLHLLGQVYLEQGQRVELSPTKPLLLLIYLALQTDWVSRDVLSDLFSPDTDPSTSRHTVRVLLNRAKALPWVSGLEAEPNRIRWSCPTDVQRFRAAIAQQDWAEAVRQYAGPLLQGFPIRDAPGFEAWVELERSDLHNAWREAALQLALSLANTDRPAEAATLLRRIWESDHFDESILQAYMRHAYTSGNREGALATYQSFKKSLFDDLGVEPLPETIALAQTILDQQPLRTPTPAPHKTTWDLDLPHLIGRQSELGELGDMLSQSECRLLVLTGLGGVGKTRLAQALALQVAAQFQHGIHLVPLAGLSNPEQMVPAIAEAVGFSFFGPKEPKEQLFDYLRKKQMLLLLDNLEHLLEGTPLLVELLEQAPALKLLVTSRHKPELPEVWAYAVEGLPFESEGEAISDAALLFIQAAKRHQPRFQTSGPDLGAIHSLGRLVEGLPLALELAAAWVNEWSAQEILIEVQNNLGTLADGMRAVMEHSWNLLSPEQQQALSRLSVFRGGFSRQAAGAVALATPYLLLSLQSRSLIQREPGGRFAMHELVRQYTAEKLTALEGEAVRGNHAHYFASFLQARADLPPPHQQQALEEVHADSDNVRLAWRFLVQQGDRGGLEQCYPMLARYLEWKNLFQEAPSIFADAASQLSPADVLTHRLQAEQGHFLWQLGQYEAARQLLEQATEGLRTGADDPSLIQTLSRLGTVLDSLGQYNPAREVFREALGLSEQQGNLQEKVAALNGLGNADLHQANYAQADGFYRQSLRLARELGNEAAIASILNNLAHTLERRGAYAQAQPLVEESLAIRQHLGNQHAVALSLTLLGILHFSQGAFEAARKAFEESLRIHQHVGDRTRAAAALNNLAGVVKSLGDVPQTMELMEQSLNIRREMGDVKGEAICLHNLGTLAEDLMDYPKATQYHQQALAINKKLGQKREVAASLMALGFSATAQQDPNAARHYLIQAIQGFASVQAEAYLLHALIGWAKLIRADDPDRARAIASLVLQHPTRRETTKQMAQEMLGELGGDSTEGLSLETLVAEITGQ